LTIKKALLGPEISKYFWRLKAGWSGRYPKITFRVAAFFIFCVYEGD